MYIDKCTRTHIEREVQIQRGSSVSHDDLEIKRVTDRETQRGGLLKGYRDKEG